MFHVKHRKEVNMSKRAERIIRKFIEKLEGEKWMYEKGYEDCITYCKNATRHYHTFCDLVAGKMHYDEITISEFNWLWEKGIELDTEYHTL